MDYKLTADNERLKNQLEELKLKSDRSMEQQKDMMTDLQFAKSHYEQIINELKEIRDTYCVWRDACEHLITE